MPAKAANLLAAVTQSGSVARLGNVTILRMDGAGAIAAPTQSFTTVARWAQGRPASGVLQKDRMQFLERFDLFLARSGAMVQTQGSSKPLYDLLLEMERIGLDIHEWSIPHAVEEMLKARAAAGTDATAAQDKGSSQ